MSIPPDRYESPEDEIRRLAAEHNARERVQANADEQARIAEVLRKLNGNGNG
jgi:hypothetical protein